MCQYAFRLPERSPELQLIRLFPYFAIFGSSNPRLQRIQPFEHLTV